MSGFSTIIKQKEGSRFQIICKQFTTILKWEKLCLKNNGFIPFSRVKNNFLCLGAYLDSDMILQGNLSKWENEKFAPLYGARHVMDGYRFDALLCH